MARIYTFGGAPAERAVTLAGLRAAKGQRRLTQTTAASEEEAAAAAEAGIEMLIGPAPLLATMRAGAPKQFITAGVKVTEFVTDDEILRQAYALMEAGADAVYMPREPRVIEILAGASIPVMTHLGLVPRLSTWIGGMRAVGRTADEALGLFRAVKAAENAGAVLAEMEVVAADLLEEITPLTSMSLVSLGSGPGGDIDYLFQEDICGLNPGAPRHARAFGDLATLEAQMARARRDALGAYRAAVDSGAFPAASETVTMRPGERDAFRAALDKETG